MKKKQLDLKKINLEDERYRTSYHFSLQEMKQSLEEIGLLNPPLVTLRDNHLTLVSGWKRVLACIELSLSSLPVYVIEDKDELKVFLNAFYENLATREFNLMEKAEILARLKKFGEQEKRIIRHYLPLLDIPQSLSHLDTYVAFSQFDTEVKRAITEKNMSFSSVKILAEFTSQEQNLLLPLLLPLGQNKRKEILEDLLEISKRNDISVKDLLLSDEVKAIQNTETLTPLQIADKTRFMFKKKRYPAFLAWKSSFDSLLKKMKWPEEITLSPSPFFEEENFTVTFSFVNKEHFKTSLLKLEKLSSRDEFSDIFIVK
jgi:ParB/RepB/Spo0J family partition protein